MPGTGWVCGGDKSITPGQQGWSQLFHSQLSHPFPATSRLGCVSWWTGASCCSERPQTMLGNTPAPPATGSGSRLLPQPSSQCSVRPPPAPPELVPAVGAVLGTGVPHGDPSPVCPHRSSAGDHHAPRDSPAQGHAGRDPLPLQSQPPPSLRHLDKRRAPAGAGQGRATPIPTALPTFPDPSSSSPISTLPAPGLVLASRRLHRYRDGERRRAGAVPLHALQQLRHRRRVPAHARPAEGEEPLGVPSWLCIP